MLIVILIFASALTATWIALLGMATRDDWIAAAYNKVVANHTAADKLRLKDAAKQEKLSKYHGAMAIAMKALLGGGPEKDLAKLEKQNERLQVGNLDAVELLVIPGYVVLRKFEKLGRSNIHKVIFNRNLELYGKKHTENRTMRLMAMLLSFPIIGIAVPLFLGAMIMGVGNTMGGLIVLSVGTVLMLILVYAMYDEVNDQANKRKDAIARQFPSVASKLALLVTSGMIMETAWKQTAYTHGLELYKEMQTTAEELDNLVSPEAAYGSFIKRCNTNETTKLASAIMQNLSKGNAEIGKLLKEMAKEAWLERRHRAKRDSEKANSKLMIPTMLLLITILVIIMVPVVMNFSSF